MHVNTRMTVSARAAAVAVRGGAATKSERVRAAASMEDGGCDDGCLKVWVGASCECDEVRVGGGA